MDSAVVANHVTAIGQGVFLVSTNTLLFITVFAHRRLRDDGMLLVGGHSFANALHGCGALLGGVYRLYFVLNEQASTPASIWDCMQQPPTIFYILGSNLIALMLVTISVDRLIAVTYISRYLNINKIYSSLVIVGVAFVGIVSYAIALTSSYYGQSVDNAVYLNNSTA